MRLHQISGGALVAIVMAVAVGAAAQTPAAPQAGFRRMPVQQGDLSIPGREAVQAVAEIDPGAQSGRHTHPGEEIGYILDGSILLEVEGRPATTMKAGEGFIIPAGTIHNARNTSGALAKVLATYVVEKGKPVATPAP